MATGARIVPRFEELSADKLGTAGSVKEVGESMLVCIKFVPEIDWKGLITMEERFRLHQDVRRRLAE
eukprot:scaffold176040_cov22-Tisochrysis_lutea.AAC.1